MTRMTERETGAAAAVARESIVNLLPPSPSLSLLSLFSRPRARARSLLSQNFPLEAACDRGNAGAPPNVLPTGLARCMQGV